MRDYDPITGASILLAEDTGFEIISAQLSHLIKGDLK